jgi:histidyl-tRNA synthetase
VELRLSHAGLIRALLAKFGLSPEEQARVFDQILDGDLAVLSSAKPELAQTLTPLLDLKGKSSGFLRNMKSLFNRDLPELEVPFNNFIEVTDLLEALNVSYQIDIASGRGFEYYTGGMFQILAGGEQVAGGGRYDALIPLMGGRDIPASGFALYLDHLMNLAKPKKLPKSAEQKILIRAESKGDALKEAFNLVSFLHEAGYAAEVHLGGREPANLKWRLNVQGRAPRFALTDLPHRRRFEAQTRDELLALLKA